LPASTPHLVHWKKPPAALFVPVHCAANAAKVIGYGNQSTQTIHQRSRGTHRLLEEVSLITITSTNGFKK
jgi:hypothetical protein